MKTRKHIVSVWIGLAVALTLGGAAPVTWAALPAPGQSAPDFALKSGSGQNLRLKEFRGQVVLINFWATWCGPCREEMPALNQLYKQYHKAGFVVFGVNIDDSASTALSMAKRLGVTFPVLFDTDKRVSRLYDVDTMPATLLVDRDGGIRYVHRGYRPGYEEKYQAQIRELLRQ